MWPDGSQGKEGNVWDGLIDLPVDSVTKYTKGENSMCKHCEQFSQNRRGFLRTVVGGIIGAAGVLVLGSSANAELKLVVPTQKQPSRCRTCGGSGQVLGTCAMCNGKGKSTTGNTCQGCGGSGQRYKFCSTCGGSGQVNAGSTTDNDWLRDKTLVAEATCGLACIEMDGGYCTRPAHHQGFHHCSKKHSF